MDKIDAGPKGRRRIPTQATVIVTLHAGRIIAYVAVTIAFVVAIWLARGASDQAAQAAHRASATSHALSREVRTVLAYRKDQLQKIHEQDVRSCESRHKLDVAMRQLIERSLQLNQRPRPGQSHAERQAGVAALQRFLRDLKGADCTSVPTLLPANPTQPPPLGKG